MPPQPRKFSAISATFCVLLFAGLPLNAAPDAATDHAGYLIGQQRMRDAAMDLANSQHPNSVESLVGRSTLLLDIGRPSAAMAVFEQLRGRLPEGSALPDYGEGICDLMSRNLSDAEKHLDISVTASDYQAHKSQVDLARAVLLAANGDAIGASSLAGAIDLPLAKEMVVLNSLRYAPTDAANISAVDDLLASWQSTPGVPMVTDAPGLRALGAVDPGAGRDIIEQVVSSPDDVRAIADLLLPQSEGAGAAREKTTSGTVTIFPTTISPTSDDLVTYYVDQDVAAVVNTSPFSFRWDTTQYTNGPHTITITFANNGQNASETQHFNVFNSDTDSAPQRVALTDADKAAIADAWNRLTLQPSYKAAELQLSRAEMQAGQRDGAIVHLTTAAAIDFEYAGGAKAITPLFIGHMAAWFPVPPGSHVGSTKAGQTSKGIWCGGAEGKEVALTFDDGPSPTDTPPLLDALRDNSVPATFMVVGIRAAAAPDIIRRMHVEGHEVEDHSFTHPNLDEATVDHIYEEILRNAVLVRAMTGIWPHFLRPPGGQSNPNVLKAAQDCGMAGAFWTVDVLPAEDLGSSAGVINMVLSHLRPGAIILMHNGTPATTQAIPELARRLRQRGYTLVTLLELAQQTLATHTTASLSGTKDASALLHR